MILPRHKRPIRNGAAWVRSKVNGFEAMVFGSLQSDAEGGMAEELSCLRRHRRLGNIAEIGGPDFARGSVSIRR